MATVILIDERFNVFAKLIMQYGLFAFFGLLAVMIGLVVLLNLTTNQIMSHMYWTVLLIVLSLLLSVSVQVYGHMDMNIVYMGFIITIIITAVMGFIGFKYGKSFITYDFDKYIKWALVALVISSFDGLFLNIPNIWVYLSIVGVIIFSLLIMSYNNKLHENAKTYVTPLYPRDSFGRLLQNSFFMSFSCLFQI